MFRFTFLLLLFVTASACGQEVVYWNLSPADGLPSSMVYDLMEDNAGRIWMATPNGLAHYNGSIIYRPKTKAVISDVSHLQLDASGNIWCTDFQKTLYQANLDSVHAAYEFESRIASVQRAQDSIYIQTRTKVYCIDNQARTPKVLHDAKDQMISFFAANAYLGMGDGGLGIEHLPTKRFIQVAENALSSAMCVVGDEFYRYYYDAGTVVWYTGLVEDTVVSGLARPGSQPSKLIGVRRTSAGLWVLSYDGAYLVDEDRWFFGSVPVSDIIESRDGTHWFSTLTEGVKIVPSLRAYRYSEGFGLASNNLNRILFTQGEELLVCDNKGALTKLNRQRILKTFNASVRKEGELLAFDESNARTYVAFGDLYALDANLNPTSRIVGNFKDLAIDSSGNVLAASSVFKWQFNVSDNGQLKQLYREQPADKSRLLSIILDENNNEWLLTISNIFFNESPLREIEIAQNPAICWNKKEDVFLYCNTDSIVILNNGKVKGAIPIPSQFRATENIVRFKYSENQLLLLFNSQLIAYNLTHKKWTRYSDSDGLPDTDLKDVDLHEGTLAFATFSGLFLLPIKQDRQNVFSAVELSQLMVNGERRHFDPKSKEVFDSDERNIAFQFACIAPTSRNDVNYRYRLNDSGSEQDFEPTKDAGNIRFRSLAAGNYQLEVFAENADRKPTEILQIPFTVLSPWYARWPFILSMLVLLIVGMMVFNQVRIRSVKKTLAITQERNRLLSNARNSKLTALRAQMNPHFLFNALNAVQGLFSMGMEEKANEAMGIFSRLMRKLLDVSDQNEIPLSDEVEMLQMYLKLEEVRFGDEFNYQIDVDPLLKTEETKIPSLLIQPYVENAIKHGLFHLPGEKKLKITIEQKANDVLLIRVADNGIGREAAAEYRKPNHKSFGTKANSKRLELLNSSRKRPITIEVKDGFNNESNVGTTVTMNIPIETVGNG